MDKASINLSLKKNNLAFWSISPNFLSNYLWYKKINSKIINDDFVKVYNKNKINLLDIDEKFDISQKNFYKKIKITKQLISEISIKIEKIAFNKKIQKKKLINLISLLFKLEKNIDNLKKNNKVSESLREFIYLLKIYIRKNEINLKNLKKFKFWWGHGTMQVAFVKDYFSKK